MAGEHSGPADMTAGTDAGPAWEKLTPEQKCDELNASNDDPRGYAARNFGADPDSAGSRPLG